jgi:hypothetical protein
MSMPIMINSPLLAASAAFEEGGAATMGGTMAGAAVPVSAILPPGSEDASAAVQAGFTARGVETTAMVAQLAVIRQLFAATMGASGAAYAATDAVNEATLAV